MKERINFTRLLSIIIAVVLVLSFSVIVATYDKSLIYIEILIFLVICILAAVCVLVARKLINSYFMAAARHITDANNSAMNDFGIAMMIVNAADEIVWYNDKFKRKNN